MKLISILLVTCSLVFSGCTYTKTNNQTNPINSNPAAEQEMEKNDSYIPWWVVKPAAANGVVNTNQPN